MRLLIKLGGTLIDNPDTLRDITRQIAELRGHELVIVHGGGKQMTAYLAERGVESKFVNGLRVSGPEVVDALLKVFAGSVNHNLVASLVSCGVPAVGLTGVDANLVECEQLDPALGQVGKPVLANAKLLETLHTGDFVPVVACVGGSRNGEIFNVNADQMAVAVASAFEADLLLFLTDVEGVRDETGATARELNTAQMQDLIASGVATGGMQAKLNAASESLRNGVKSVTIALGSAPSVIARVLDGEAIGTRLVP